MEEQILAAIAAIDVEDAALIRAEWERLWHGTVACFGVPPQLLGAEPEADEPIIIDGDK